MITTPDIIANNTNNVNLASTHPHTPLNPLAPVLLPSLNTSTNNSNTPKNQLRLRTLTNYNLTIATINITGGFRHKIDDITETMTKSHIDILIVTETWLNPNYPFTHPWLVMNINYDSGNTKKPAQGGIAVLANPTTTQTHIYKYYSLTQLQTLHTFGLPYLISQLEVSIYHLPYHYHNARQQYHPLLKQLNWHLIHPK